MKYKPWSTSGKSSILQQVSLFATRKVNAKSTIGSLKMLRDEYYDYDLDTAGCDIGEY